MSMQEKLNGEAFRFCPTCGTKGLFFELNKLFRCTSCGFHYYHNVAAAAGAIIETRGRILFIVRGAEPSAGMLALPGGFIDPGERAEDAILRECREEIGWEPDNLEFLVSFPNRYEYGRILYNTCDFFFIARSNALDDDGYSLDSHEATGLVFLTPEEIKPKELAFDSTRRAMSVYLQKRGFQ